MCGIVGYIGKREAQNILIAGIRRLEYRGYDSAGIALVDNGVNVIKSQGKVAKLEEKLVQNGNLTGFLGIAHTRWATHGAPNDINAHPQTSQNGKITVVHNGIIENYLTLKNSLHGYQCQSDTDTEIVANLLEHNYKDNMLTAIAETCKTLKGSYALGILCSDTPDILYAAKKESPLLVAVGEGENFIASDMAAVLEHTNSYYLLDESEIAILTKDSVKFYDFEQNELQKNLLYADWDIAAAEKGGYPHFMLKEIMEQPKAIKETMNPRIINNDINLDGIEIQADKIHIVACGSAAYAGLIGKAVIEKLARIPVEVHLASEFRYNDPILSPNNLCIAISQSGETADTLAALRYAKKCGIKTLAIVNVIGSAIARESDNVLPIWAGPEIAVATTKAYSAQIITMYLLALKLAKTTLPTEKFQSLLGEMQTIPEKVQSVLDQQDIIQKYAKEYAKRTSIFLIGRGVDFAAVTEGSLKLKEISYIHSEAYAAGELKHGTISLVEDGTLVIAAATTPHILEKTLSNLQEVLARGANSLIITTEALSNEVKFSANIIKIPNIHYLFTASLTTVVMQLFAYYVAFELNCEIDMPRNLAKSVTVE
ncbi:MAG: glutamine--fructose-6-phosphate transaminase (isomerizing) [Turicibacter sp.]|nr:glutamine--fructose-6-phosphate transaminase (isomerizing) [Turicibacter sp.]